MIEMLLIKAHIARSPISGMGLFADERIPRGMPIWSFIEGKDFEVAPEDLDNPLEVGMNIREGQRFVLHFGYKDKETGKYIVCVDEARYMNHSADPNTDNKGEITTAKRDIEAGEELTCDYFEFDADAGRKLRP